MSLCHLWGKNGCICNKTLSDEVIKKRSWKRLEVLAEGKEGEKAFPRVWVQHKLLLII